MRESMTTCTCPNTNGALRHLLEGIDPPTCQVHPVEAETDETTSNVIPIPLTSNASVLAAILGGFTPDDGPDAA